MSDRADFEGIYKSIFKGHHMDRDPSGDYVNIAADAAWRVWQARAQPEPSTVVQSSECSTCNGEGGTYEPEGHRDAMLFVCPDCDGSGDAPEPSAGTVPEGWKLVPIEPTHEMTERGAREADWYAHNAHHCYQAMLYAAPQPPQEGA